MKRIFSVLFVAVAFVTACAVPQAIMASESNSSSQVTSATSENLFGYIQEPVEGLVKVGEESTSDTSSTDAVLPAQYTTALTPVRNQSPYGTCWAFATCASAESSYLKKTGETIQLSCAHLAYYTYNMTSARAGLEGDSSVLTNPEKGFNSGGNYYFASRALSAGTGFVEESVLPYSDIVAVKDVSFENAAYQSMFTSDKQYALNSYQLVSCKSISFADTDAIKQAIIDIGAAGVSYYAYAASNSSNWADYYGTAPDGRLAFYNAANIAGTNHAIVIVGWDDDFSRENFNEKNRPDHDGAWLCKNSWGSSWSNDGYFWISYDEMSLNKYISGGEYYYSNAHFFEIEPVNAQENMYQYDGNLSTMSCNITVASGDTEQAANVFTTQSHETLTSVSFMSFTTDFDITIDVYKDIKSGNPSCGTHVATQKISNNYSGYINVPLDYAVDLPAGTTYSVVLTFTNNTSSSHMLCVPIDYSQATSSLINIGHADAGESYWYDTDNQLWSDFGLENNCNLRIKAFTVDCDSRSSIASGEISLVEGTTYSYTGSAIEPSIVVTLGGTTLIEGTDYALSYSDNVNAGTAKAYVVGINKYKGELQKCFYIDSALPSSLLLDFDQESYEYTGEAIEPTFVATVNNGVEVKLGTDYTVSYTNNVNVGKATVTLKFMGNYKGYGRVNFDIVQQTLAGKNIALSDAVFAQTGDAQYPEVTVFDKQRRELTEGNDYQVSYSDGCIKAGTYSVTIEGIGSYTGTVTKNFVITSNSINNCNVALDQDTFVYNGSVQKPVVTVSTTQGVALVENEDYLILSNQGCDAGTYSIALVGIGNYSGCTFATYTIEPQAINLKNASLSCVTYSYTGTEKTPKVTLKSAQGSKLVQGTDFEVSYSNNTKVGKAVATITGINNYSGTVQYGFTINPLKPCIKAVSATKTSSKAITVTTYRTAKAYGASYIQIRYRAKGSSVYRYVKTTSNSARISSLKSNTKYYVAVRTCTKVGGKLYYSAWSNTNSVYTR